MRSNRFRALIVLFFGSLVALFPSPSEASRFAFGYQHENWGTVDLDKNPSPGSSKIGDRHLRFDMATTEWYLEEPGFLFSLIAGVAQNEANEVNARNEAIRKGEHTYTWSYATPPPIPDGRWFRWGYAAGRTVGAEGDSNVVFLYRRYDANIVMAPKLIGNSDFYWMLGSTLSGTSVRIYQRGEGPSDDWSYMDTPIDAYFGWQPRVFPYLMLEGLAGVDLIDLLGPAILGWENYSPFWTAGGKATLGVDWFTVYTSFLRKQDPLWGGGKYNRRYVGNWLTFGARLDIGNIFFRLLGGGKP